MARGFKKDVPGYRVTAKFDIQSPCAEQIADGGRINDEQREDSIMMEAAPIRTVLGVITDFLASNPTPEAIIAYRLPPDLEARAHDLSERNGEGELTPDEVEEMHDFMRVDQVMSLLKAKMQLKLKQQSK